MVKKKVVKVGSDKREIAVNQSPEQVENLLKAAKERAKGKSVVKNGIIQPGDINLEDSAFSPKPTSEKGKIITEEDLKKEEEFLKKEKQRYTKDFHKQYNKWKKKDEWSEYDWCDFDHQDYLVRLFKMDISDYPGYVTLNYEWSPILRNWKIKDTQMTDGVYAIAKILAVGAGITSDKYKVGDIVLVPSSDIVGDDWNPKFLHVMQFQKSQNMQPVLPDGMRQRIPNVEIKWEHYKFMRPWVPVPEEQDHLTYLIPEPKVRGSYKK